MRRPIVHLGSWDHEYWSIQREVFAVTDAEVSYREALTTTFAGRDVLSWCPGYWRQLPEPCRRGSRTVCFFHHTEQWMLRQPEIVAGICMNRGMERALRSICPEKPVFLLKVGGAEAAREHARREHPAPQIRLLVSGSGSARISDEDRRAFPPGASPLRKSSELLCQIADRLDPARYAFVFIGPDWEPYRQALRERGWTVIHPGPLEEPLHYRYFGEGDIYLMLSRLEGGPLPLLEAMGAGLWPICTPVGMAPDLLRDGENGSLVPAYDGCNHREVADAVARRIEQLDRAGLCAAAESIRNSVADYTWPNFSIQMTQVLTQVFG